MAERLVVDTGPLIALARAAALDVAGALPFQFVCPPAVRAELDAGTAADQPAIAPAWLMVIDLEREPDPVAVATLDTGESAVIQLALEQGIARVCIDERKGRRMARAVGLQVVGTLGLLLLAKRRGDIDALRPFVERLQAAGVWYHPALVQRILAAAAE